MFTIIVYLIEFHNTISVNATLKLIGISFLTKQAFTPVLAFLVAAPIVGFLNAHKNKTSTTANIKELFVDKSNKSSFRDLVIDLGVNHPLGQYSEPRKVKNMMFRTFPAGLQFDMHVAPCTQYIIYLEGQVEVTTSGGESLVFKAGDVLLANDLSGQGHITKTLSSGRSIVIETM